MEPNTKIMNRALWLFVLLGMFPFGCDDEEEPITEVEANHFSVAFSNAAIDALETGKTYRIGVPVNVQYTHTHYCPDGGRISVVGSLTGAIDKQGNGQLWLQIHQSVIACEMSESGRTVIFDGSLSLAGTFSYLGGQPATQQTLLYSGWFDWEVDNGLTGDCYIDLTMLLASAGGDTSLSGTVCGFQINL